MEMSVDYSGRTHRAYLMFGHQRPRLYIGIYKSRDAAHAAAAAVQLAGGGAEAALAAQKSAWDSMDPGYVPLWRSAQGKDGRRNLYVIWNGDKIFLGSFRMETAARSALDAFLTYADEQIEDAVAKAKEIAIEGRFTADGSDETVAVTVCPGQCTLTPFCVYLWTYILFDVAFSLDKDNHTSLSLSVSLSLHRLSKRYRGAPA
jgi:hypothetical protein